MAQGDRVVTHPEVSWMVSVMIIHFYEMPNVSRFIFHLEKRGSDRYRLNYLSG